jgi:hypothetical protein
MKLYDRLTQDEVRGSDYGAESGHSRDRDGSAEVQYVSSLKIGSTLIWINSLGLRWVHVFWAGLLN